MGKALGLKVPRGASIVSIGSGKLLTSRSGQVTVVINLNAAAKAAFRKTKLASISTSLTIKLAKAGKSSSVTKRLVIKK